MKNWFKLSLVANVGLIAASGVLFQRYQAAGKAPDSESTVAVAPEVQPPTPAPESNQKPSAPVRPFRWSQLESTDYRVYIANLRRIGCPEQTLRDIIVADVDGLFGPKRDKLRRKEAADLAGGALGARSLAPELLQKGLDQLQQQEVTLVKELLDPSSSAPLAASDAQPPASNRVARFQAREQVGMPVAFLNPGPDFPLDAAQAQIINELRQTFNEQISGLNLDPADPEYRKRWLQAQKEADSMMLAHLGLDFKEKYQAAAVESTGAAR